MIAMQLDGTCMTVTRIGNSTTPKTVAETPTMSGIPKHLTFEQQAHDIYHIVFLLRQKLVQDLIPGIWNQAEIYWTTETQTSFNKDAVVTERRVPREILRSEVMPSPTRLQHPVRKIVFTITSHDQGWAGNKDQGSWTWFTARKVTSHLGNPPSAAGAGAAAVGPNNNSRRELCRNPVAKRRWTVHEVTWKADSDDAEEAEWVSSLEVGDFVALDAWARFPGWSNTIQQASITIHTAAVS
ncbi:hypothetical protein Q7P37_002285 [Cladosporium fusiforme]